MQWYPPPDYRVNQVKPSPSQERKHGFVWNVAATVGNVAAAAATSAVYTGLMYAVNQTPALDGAFGWIGQAVETTARYLPMLRLWADTSRRASPGVSITSISPIDEIMVNTFRGTLDLITADPARNGPMVPSYTKIWLMRASEMWNPHTSSYVTTATYRSIATLSSLGDDVDDESVTQIPLDITDSYAVTLRPGYEVSVAHPHNIYYSLIWDSRMADGTLNTDARMTGFDLRLSDDASNNYKCRPGHWQCEIYPNFPNSYGLSNTVEDEETYVETGTPTNVYFFNPDGSPV